VIAASTIILAFSGLATKYSLKIAGTMYSRWISGYTQVGSFGYVISYFLFVLGWLLGVQLLTIISFIVAIPSAALDLKSSLEIYQKLRREMKR
jgi:hypothetical protein